MRYLFLLLRVLLFLSAVGGLCYSYLWREASVPILTQVLFWLLLLSSSLGIWKEFQGSKGRNC